MLLLENSSTSYSSRLGSSTGDNKWHVKITGILRGIKRVDLANILNLPVQNIVIPLHQQNGPVWFAWLNNFKNKQEAVEFATCWNGKPLHSTLSTRRIRCIIRSPDNITGKKTLIKST